MPSAKEATQSQRSQELRKYFAPSQGIHAPNSGYNAYIQDDDALTSFAETVAWRLAANRVMISLIDGERQYFLAGAELDGKKMIGRMDWFGCASISVHESLCRYTIAAEDSTSEYPCLVIEDLSQDERFCQLPVVNGSVAAYKSYAGTSISTSRGVKIGSIFLLDNNPRPEGLSLEQRKVMCQSAKSVMTHLEMHREAAERRRVSLMSQGIRRFLQSRSHKEDEDMTDREYNGGGSSDMVAFEPRSTTENQDTVKSTFESAASILRESLEIESGGVMFVDTAVSFSGAGHTDAYSDPSTSMGQNMETADGKDKPVFRHIEKEVAEPRSPSSLDAYNGQMRTSENRDAAATIIAMSTSTQQQRVQSTNRLLDGKTLQTLLNMYPEGNVWYFDEEGYFSSLEQDEQNEQDEQDEKQDKSTKSDRRRFDVTGRLSEEKAEATLLKKRFDEARQLIFLPMWDAATRRWYAGCLAWSHSAVPVFTVSSEVAYLAAFTNSITVEISRLDAIRADQAKADFISSISHEFRSPLHGILASAEFLREVANNETQSELISTVQSCGRTLLETIDHVLDFSKINSFEKAKSGDLHGGPLPNELYSVTNLAVLCEEVVDGMIIAKSFDDVSSSKNSTARSRPASRPVKANEQQVEVVLDFEKQNWHFLTQPGALRRIIMNIFGNAQKYTDEGYIQVLLRSEDPVQARAKGAKGMSPRKSAVSLVIKDSGRGISSEYLKNRLYTPFAQDNTFASGVGLGLSIVRSIVQQMGGFIAVHSLRGKGTEVEICLPVEAPDHSHGTFTPERNVDRSLDADNIIQALREVATKTIIALQRPTDLSRDPSNGQNMILDRVETYISDWYGFTVKTFTDWGNVPAADFTVALETHEPSTPSAVPRRGNHYIPMLLLNGTLTSKGRKQYPAGMPVGHVTRPIGPYNLARHLLSIVQRGWVIPLSGPLESVPFASNANDNHRPGEQPKVLPSFSEPRQLAIKIPEGDLEQNFSSMDVRSTDIVLPPIEDDKQLKPKGGLQILAVDDNEINLQLLQRFLSKRKNDIVDSARNGFEAVAAVQKAVEPYDVVFMDISMPGMDGFQATRKIREYENEIASQEKDDDIEPDQGTRKNSRSYIVALTGLAATRDREEATKCGFDDYLTKPIPFKKVGHLLQERTGKKNP